MDIFSAIVSKFWASIMENPWMILIHLMDIIIVAVLIYKFIKALAGTKIMSLIQGVIFVYHH